MAFFEFKNIKVAGVACAVPKNEIKTESYEPVFGDEEVEKFMAMPLIGRWSIRLALTWAIVLLVNCWLTRASNPRKLALCCSLHIVPTIAVLQRRLCSSIAWAYPKRPCATILAWAVHRLWWECRRWRLS